MKDFFSIILSLYGDLVLDRSCWISEVTLNNFVHFSSLNKHGQKRVKAARCTLYFAGFHVARVKSLPIVVSLLHWKHCSPRHYVCSVFELVFVLSVLLPEQIWVTAITLGTELKISYLYDVHVVVLFTWTGTWFYGSINDCHLFIVYVLLFPLPLYSALIVIVAGHTTAFSWNLSIAKAMIQLYSWKDLWHFPCF